MYRSITSNLQPMRRSAERETQVREGKRYRPNEKQRGNCRADWRKEKEAQQRNALEAS